MRSRYFLFPVLVFLLAFSAGSVLIHYNCQLYKEQKIEILDRELTSISNHLTQIIEHRLSLLYGLRSFILARLDVLTSNPAYADEIIPLFLEGLHGTLPDIRIIQVAPGGVHRYVYPVNEITQQALGHNLLTDERPAVRQQIEQIIAGREIGLSGPYPLRQDGSLGLVARLPIYQQEQFWGLVVIVLNVEHILKGVGINQSNTFALRVAGEEPFYGSAQAFSGRHLVTTIELPGNQWELAVITPATGLKPEMKWGFYLLAGVLSFLLSSLLYQFSTRQWRLESAVDKATSDLLRQKSELDNSLKKLKRVQKKLKQMAMTDALTGLYARRFIFEWLKKELAAILRKESQLSCLMLDIDHFKQFNDTFGHLHGDEALKTVATCIKNNIRQADIAGRFGGEEFIVLLPETTRTSAIQVAEKIRLAIAEITAPAPITISIGVAVCDWQQLKQREHDIDSLITELIHAADTALYLAKKQGRNRVVALDN